MLQSTPPVITIDGPSGTGKGTLCCLLAQYLGWHRLDSGAIYRVLALSVERQHIALADEEKLVAAAHALDFGFTDTGQVFLNGENVTHLIRTEACGAEASILSALLPIRTALLKRQQDFLKPPGLVTDGRDMGTVVFPNAVLKLFLTASIEVRAKRRYLELKAAGICVNLERVISELAARDTRDSSRSFSPLKPADDAHVIDTTLLTANQVFDLVLPEVQKMGETR